MPDAEREPAPTPETPPAAAALPPAAPDTPPAVGATGTTEPPAAAQPSAGETVPKYRLDETIGARDREKALRETAEAEIVRLRAQLAAPPAQIPPAAPAPPAEPDPQIEAVKARLLEVFPELKHLKDLADLAGQKGNLLATTEAIARYEQAEQAFYDRHTESQLGSLHKLAAEHVIGTGKAAADLPEEVREVLTQRFAAWVAKDPARSARYNALDQSLVGEYWPIFRAAMFDPVRRAASVSDLAANDNRPALPVGGSQAMPVAPAPPKPPAASDDEDAIHGRAWQQLQAAGR